MRASTVAILIGLGASLSACGGTYNRGVEAVHQPVVSRANYVLDVDANYGGLSAGDTYRLTSWFESLELGYGDHVSVDGGNGAASPAVTEAVGQIAARYGLLLDSTAPVTSGAIAPGTARVVVSRAKASVPGCPDWSRQDGTDFENHAVSNFGCGVNGNLAAMVANPDDLIHGQTGAASVDASTAAKAIKSYRDRKPTGEEGLKNEATRRN